MSSLFIREKGVKAYKKIFHTPSHPKTFSDIVHIKKGFFMKKNILFAQSFVALSLLTAAPVLGMDNQVIKYKEKSTGSQNNRKKRRFDEKIQQKKVEQLKQKLAKEEEKCQLAQQQQKKFEQKKQQITDETIEQQKQEHTIRFRNPLLEDLHNSKLFIQQSQLNNVIEVIKNPLYNPEAQNSSEAQIPSNLVQSEVEIITLALPEHATRNNTNDNYLDLNQSIMFPTTTKELSWLEKLSYHTSTANQILQQVISNLELGKFDTTDKISFDRLEEAILTATKNNDIDSLAKIAALCQQKYSTTIRITDQAAQPASQVLNSHYSKELTLANNNLQDKHEEKLRQWNAATATCMASIINAITIYKQNVGVINGNYDASLEQETKRITDLRRDVSTFSCLNRDIRPGTADLLKNNQLKTPNNIHATTMSISENKFNSILTTVEQEIPTTKELQKNPTYIQNLTQKCLTNK